MDRVWPNFFIIGAAKAGTTSLHRYVGEHPETYMSEVKEPEFFSRTLDAVEAGERPEAEAVDEYLALFEQGTHRAVRGESSPSYMWRPEAPDRIAERVEEPRFLACLRDPVERAYSDYLMGIRRGTLEGTFLGELERELEAESFRDADPFIERGRYHRHLRRYIDRFGHEHLHVILLDDLKANPLATLKGIASFLGIEEGGMEQVDFETVHNPYGVPRNQAAETILTSELVGSIARLLMPERLRIYVGEHLLLEKPEKPPMDPEARDLLEDIFDPEIEQLAELLDRDLSALRSGWSTERMSEDTSATSGRTQGPEPGA